MKAEWNISFVPKTAAIAPPGFQKTQLKTSKQSLKQVSKVKEESASKTRLKKAWEAALSPMKAIPMNLFMMYMSGNTVQIFSMMIVVMLIYNSIKSMSTLSSVFDQFVDKNDTADLLVLHKTTFIALQLVLLCLGVYKMDALGLLPTSTSDWLAFEEPRLVEAVL